MPQISYTLANVIFLSYHLFTESLNGGWRCGVGDAAVCSVLRPTGRPVSPIAAGSLAALWTAEKKTPTALAVAVRVLRSY